MTGALRQRGDLAQRKVEHELLLLDTELAKIHQLNETATFVWERWSQVADAREMAKLLAQKYDVSEDTAVSDVAAILARLQELGLLVGE